MAVVQWLGENREYRAYVITNLSIFVGECYWKNRKYKSAKFKIAKFIKQLNKEITKLRAGTLVGNTIFMRESPQEHWGHGKFKTM